MIAKLLNRIFGSRNDRVLKRYESWVQAVNGLSDAMKSLSDEALKNKTAEFRQRFKAGETLNDLLPEAFAVVREVSERRLGMRHFDVQLIGAMALHEGNIAEMSTGEGKTLTATLAVYLNCLSSHPVHVVTVNDYLANRDASWMAPVYEALGLTVGVVVPGMPKEKKREAYACDVINATNNELGFDYLRDKMAFDKSDCVQGELYFAIVDEVDSILIDEARTPLIISGDAEDSSSLYTFMNKVVQQLQPQVEKEGPGDYYLDEKSKQAFLTESGHSKMEKLLQEHGVLAPEQSLYDISSMVLVHHMHAALRAVTLFKRDVDYIVNDNKVIIVDEHTGRTMPGRRWSEGLHQALEAKEGVQIQNESQTLASITFQNFFRLYKKLAGMTGTADTESYEFQQIYNLEVVVVPTNRPCVRDDRADIIYLTQEEKYDAIVEDIKRCSQKQQPVLVGTISIESSEYLSRRLTAEKISHQVLNAKYHEKEALIIAQAGRPGAVTIATNMAGRGTDIVLGGSLTMELANLEGVSDKDLERSKAAWQERHDIVVQSGGLHVLGTERHESRRIDNQLRGRSGRQGDPGSSQFFLSLEDDLMRRFASDAVRGLMRRTGMGHGEAITHPWITRAIENAQRKVEGFNFDIRKQLLEYDNVANDQRQVIYNQRDELLGLDDVSENVLSMCQTVMDFVVDEFIPPGSLDDMWNAQGLEMTLRNEFGLDCPVTEWVKDPATHEEHIRDRVRAQSLTHYQSKEQLFGAAPLRKIEKSVLLHCLDVHWKEHLAMMDHLRKGIHLRGYAQKDPKQEFKREAFALFTKMLDHVKRDIVSVLLRLDAHTTEPESPPEIRDEHLQFVHQEAHSVLKPIEGQGAANAQDSNVLSFENALIGRNQVCPCGSGEKYKSCHGKL